jgi:LysM repeat protein
MKEDAGLQVQKDEPTPEAIMGSNNLSSTAIYTGQVLMIARDASVTP